ncbi:MAG: uroporphyrinogen-III synthase [Alphaproteobacteria bacterium]
MRIVVTRPAKDAEAMAAALSKRGHDVLIHPLLEVVFRPLSSSQFHNASALIVTSRNALRALATSEVLTEARALPVYCVGEATAKYAAHLGFSRVHTGPGTAKSLADIILQTPEIERQGEFLYLTGKHLAFDLEAALKAHGVNIRRVISYETHEAPETATRQIVEKLCESIDGVILMSPRTASVFARALKKAKQSKAHHQFTCYCLSEAVAAPLQQIADITIRVAHKPSEADLLALIDEAR